MYLDELLSKKWKIEKDNEEGKIYVVMKEISEKTYLHNLCKAINEEFYQKFENVFNVKLLPELKEFYKYYNGCRLFLSSISIYGVNVPNSNPYDITLNNYNKHAELANNGITDEKLLDDIVFIGGVGDYEMYYKQSEINNPIIYLSPNGSLQIHKTFGSIKELLTYYINALIPEYDEKGYREHPLKNELYQKYPALKNRFDGDIDWEVDDDKTSTK